MVADMVADMKVHMVADMEVDKVAQKADRGNIDSRTVGPGQRRGKVYRH